MGGGGSPGAAGQLGLMTLTFTAETLGHRYRGGGGGGGGGWWVSEPNHDGHSKGAPVEGRIRAPPPPSPATRALADPGGGGGG